MHVKDLNAFREMMALPLSVIQEDWQVEKKGRCGLLLGDVCCP